MHPTIKAAFARATQGKEPIACIPAHHASYKAARDVLPIDAEWSCMFGNSGNPGFVEYWRQPNGQRWIIENGTTEASVDRWQVTLRSDPVSNRV